MARTRTRPTVLARYLAWSGPRLSRANRRARLAGDADTLDRWGFHLHLFLWAVRSGLIPKPDELDRPYSAFVAEAFRKDPGAVEAEARRYWQARHDDAAV